VLLIAGSVTSGYENNIDLQGNTIFQNKPQNSGIDTILNL
jgi:hypothetical protein